ncbi:hypothetical protein KBC70_01925 [Candidatus Woesebacteria bacterium]|jgi:hypothetical protein|nr:hypothetical protein [Candidatus Woesebacteria bacterium]
MGESSEAPTDIHEKTDIIPGSIPLRPKVEIIDSAAPSTELAPALGPVYRDEASFRIIDVRTGQVEEGTYFVDTRTISPRLSRDIDPEMAQWELMVQCAIDGALAPTDDDDSSFSIPNILKPQGEIWRLHDYLDDPDGYKAGRIHRKAVELARSNVRPDHFDAEMRALLEELEAESALKAIEGLP